MANYAWRHASMTLHAFVDVAVVRLPHRITAAYAAGLLANGDPRVPQRAAIAATVLAVFLTGLAAFLRGQFGWTLPGFGSAAVLASRYAAWDACRPARPSPVGLFMITAAVLVLLWL